MPGLWRHKWQSIMLILIVDDFRIEYCEQFHAHQYSITTDWSGLKFAGIDLNWDYTKCICHLTMPGTIPEICIKYNHSSPTKP